MMIHTRLLNRSFYSGVVAGVLLCSGWPAPLFAQVAGGTIQGVVSDTSGAAIAGAHATITELATGVVHSTATNSSGFYTVPDLQPSVYSVAVNATGFSNAVAGNITLTVGANVTVNLT